MKLNTKSRPPCFIDSDGTAHLTADAVRLIRRRKNWNVARLAEELSVSPRTVEDWEQGRSTPTKPTLILLSMI